MFQKNTFNMGTNDQKLPRINREESRERNEDFLECLERELKSSTDHHEVIRPVGMVVKCYEKHVQRANENMRIPYSKSELEYVSETVRELLFRKDKHGFCLRHTIDDVCIGMVFVLSFYRQKGRRLRREVYNR